MATPMELDELERGDGAWENIQEVLRLGFRNLWNAFAGVDDRVSELHKAVAVQTRDFRRQQQHLEAIAQTLNAMSEQLRVTNEQEEAAKQQLEARLQALECQIHNQMKIHPTEEKNPTKVSITKVERRLSLLEEELGHIVAAIDQKTDAEDMLQQRRSLEEAIHKRCTKEAFDQEVLVLQERLLRQRQEIEETLSTSTSAFQAQQEALLRLEMETWTTKAQELIRTSLDQDNQRQREAVGSMNIQIKLCCEALEAQQKRLDDVKKEIQDQLCVTIAADREDVARQCREAHSRIDYQFQSQEDALEQIRVDQCGIREEIAATVSQSVQQMTAAVDELDRRVLDRQLQELKKLHHQLAEELQLTLANSLKASEAAKDKDLRKMRQHQHVVGRKMAELDQMLQLMGRQLIQNTSQLQVVRNEQLVHNFQTEDAAYDDELLLRYDDAIEEAKIAQIPPQVNADRVEEDAELLARRSQHQELQEQLDKKLRDYKQVLSSSKQIPKEHGEQPKK
ncbi:hypothetical protein DVH05_022705 [Phytophthora capsici]|nr:hypothetical protein DVH05_022705 [Phytophthora capsici]